MNILFMGGHELGATVLRNLIENGINIVGVVVTETNDEWYKGVDVVAEENDLLIFREKDVNNKEFLSKLEALNINLIVSVNFDQILKKEIINLPTNGCINTHASLLPCYRGRAPLNWAILKGEKEVGVTVHYIDEGIDTGDIIIQKSIKVNSNDYIGDILEKIKNIYPECVYEAIKDIEENKVHPISQKGKKSSYYGKRTREDGEIDLSKSGLEILNLIRAVSKPYPGAFIKKEKYELVIWRATLNENFEEFEKYPVGKFLEIDNKIGVKLIDSILVIEEYEKVFLTTDK